MSEQNWIVTLTKTSHLDVVEYLVQHENVPALLRHLMQRYPEYDERDTITIRPTEMIHYE